MSTTPTVTDYRVILLRTREEAATIDILAATRKEAEQVALVWAKQHESDLLWTPQSFSNSEPYARAVLEVPPDAAAVASFPTTEKGDG